MVALALVLQAALAHDGPYICADEAGSGTCVLADAQPISQQAKASLTAGLEG